MHFLAYHIRRRSSLHQCMLQVANELFCSNRSFIKKLPNFGRKSFLERELLWFILQFISSQGFLVIIKHYKFYAISKLFLNIYHCAETFIGGLQTKWFSKFFDRQSWFFEISNHSNLKLCLFLASNRLDFYLWLIKIIHACFSKDFDILKWIWW